MSYKDRSLEFGDHTVISGRNRTGKTTVKHLLNWILFDKNAEGRQAIGIEGKNQQQVGAFPQLFQAGGVLPLDQAFVQEVSAYCKAHDILVCVDEVQTGIGRTGTLFCYAQYGIEPDIVSMAKGLGGGVPIGAILCGEKCADTLQPGQHGSTFGGNLLACRAAQTVLSVVDQPQFLASVKEKGEYIREQLLAMHSPAIREVRGMGLMLGIGVDPQKRSDYVRALQEKGVLVLTAGEDTIRLLPPLVITKEDIDQALACMKEVLK